MVKKPKTQGNCIISDEVIATIACAAAQEVPGVAGMASRPSELKTLILTGAERSVAVNHRESTITLDVYINIKVNGKIQEIATAVQQNVKSAVQAMTERPVTRVNVHIAGVDLEENTAQ